MVLTVLPITATVHNDRLLCLVRLGAMPLLAMLRQRRVDNLSDFNRRTPWERDQTPAGLLPNR